MPYKRVDPVGIDEILEVADTLPDVIDIKDIQKKRYEGHFTICQMLRDIFQMTDNEDIRYKCRVAMAMSKKMHEKLKWYRDRNPAQ